MTRLTLFNAIQSTSTRRSRTPPQDPHKRRLVQGTNSSTPLWRTMSPGKKMLRSVPSTDVIAATRKKKFFEKKKKKHSQAALLRLFSYVRPSPDPEWRSAPDGAHPPQLVCRQVARFFHFGSVLPNNPYNSPCGCEGI